MVTNDYDLVTQKKRHYEVSDDKTIDKNMKGSSNETEESIIDEEVTDQNSASKRNPTNSYTGKKPKWWKALSNRRGTKSQRATISRMMEKGFVIPRIKYQHFVNIEELFSSSQLGNKPVGEECMIEKEIALSSDHIHNTSVSNLELGFGLGDNLLTNAMNFPENFYIGAEIHQPGVGTILSRMEKSIHSGQYWMDQTLWKDSGDNTEEHEIITSFPYKNVRIYPGDGVKLLTHLPPKSIDNIYLTFPDPWPQESHSHWRVIQLEIVNLIGYVLKQAGNFFLATDAVCFEDWCIAIFDEANKIEWEKNGVECWISVPCPDRSLWLPVISKYEEKGIKEGRTTRCRCWKKMKIGDT